jgi:hypothetical protein
MQFVTCNTNDMGVFKLGWPVKKFGFSEKSDFFAPNLS